MENQSNSFKNEKLNELLSFSVGLEVRTPQISQFGNFGSK
jgi:hypothetical protein